MENAERKTVERRFNSCIICLVYATLLLCNPKEAPPRRLNAVGIHIVHEGYFVIRLLFIYLGKQPARISKRYSQGQLSLLTRGP
jgi:hypothetical protein